MSNGTYINMDGRCYPCPYRVYILGREMARFAERVEAQDYLRQHGVHQWKEYPRFEIGSRR